MTDTATLSAFLFTDIEGSSLKWLNHRAAMQAALAEHDRILRDAIAANEGEVFKTAGDAFFAAFKRPSDAVTAAITVQKVLALHDWSAVESLKVRMAVHCGTAEKRQGDYFGPALNRCARLLVLGHGGQILVTSATAELLASEREVKEPTRLIGTHPLDDPMQPVGIHQVVVAGLSQDFPPLRTPETRPTNLPRHLTPLIGRADELGTIKELIGASRLVTLTGPGGVGKTRLAVEAGIELLPHFAQGVWLVELAPLSDPKLVVSALGTALRLDLRGSRSAQDILISHLENQEIVIVLDNCEHVVTAVAELTEALLNGTSKVRIVASSQELLGLPGEQVLRVASLSVPETATPTADEALSASAVRLFVERAKAADPRFVFDAKAAPAVSDICRRLDGIALAIEMAAARVPMLGLEALAQGLDARFRILTGGKRTALPRQRTLHAALDWSHALLNEPDRVVFRRLGQFAGGFTLKAATAVASDATVQDFEVIDCLSDLVAKSLVAADTTDAGTRYRLLETTRAYAQEKLSEAAETDTIARRHALYFRELTVRCNDDLGKMPTIIWRNAYLVELDNIRIAIDWSFGSSGDAELGIALAALSFVLFDHVNLSDENRKWLDIAKSKLDPAMPRATQAVFLYAMGVSLFHGGYAPSDRAADALEHAAQLLRELGEERMLARLLWMLGLLHVNRGEAAQAEAALAEAKPIIERLEGSDIVAWYHSILGALKALQGQPEQARQSLDLGIRYARNVGSIPAQDFSEMVLGMSALGWGENEFAEELLRVLRDRIRHSPYVDMRRLLGTCAFLSHALASNGKFEEALAVMREAVSTARKIGAVSVFIDRFIYVTAMAGRSESAARLAGWGYHQFERHKLDRWLKIVHGWIDPILNESLPAAEIERLMVEGAAMSEDEACKLLLEN